MPPNPQLSNKAKPFRLNTMILAIISAALLLGIVIGVSLTSLANSNPENINSSVYIDSAAPDANVCVQYGASAIVTDTRIYLTLNPFKVYVTQPRMQPGCVLRTSDWAILQQRNLVTSQQISNCKSSLNTFAYTGKLENSPQVACVYQNDAAGNLFASHSAVGTTPQ
ncbi:DUF3172 domain-containing protein [Calothrix sp. FACHB-156]|uniref:DUF3172 domain-containing protein n=1 Tax=Calothrix sp. NIES-2100 TaxID=1954172 RepID=UPI000B5E4A33|nr:DUF3172 domain-containing protein [Calothrix sp. FACHB-156]BAY28058.1 hypothetical protein NIES2100_78870 [Calothrix sp. NIES-2100]